MDFKPVKRALMHTIAAANTGDATFTKETFDAEMGILKDEGGFYAILITSIMAVVVGSVMLYIGLFVSVTVYNAIPTNGLSTSDNATLATVKGNVNTAFTLLGIILIVGGAIGIISVLMGLNSNPAR